MANSQEKELITKYLDEAVNKGIIKQDSIIFLFGYGYNTQFISNELYYRGTETTGFLDNSTSKIGKCFGAARVIRPDDIPITNNTIIIIYSSFAQVMMQQIEKISKELLEKCIVIPYAAPDSKCFWDEKYYDKARVSLYKGLELYQQYSRDYGYLIICPYYSVGDYALAEMSLNVFLKDNGIKKHAILVRGKGAKKVIELFDDEKAVALNSEEIDAICRFVMFVGEDHTKCLIVFPQFFACRRISHIQQSVPLYSGTMYDEYVYQTRCDVKKRYPNIYKDIDKSYLYNRGMLKGRSVVLSPFTNSLAMLPIMFWEELARKLSELGFVVFTNTSGSQRAIKGSRSLEVSFESMGTVLEHAGYLISLRSGLNDICGRAKCKQIVLYRDSYNSFHIMIDPLIVNDLHIGDVGPDIIQMRYTDDVIEENVNRVLNEIRGGLV